MQHVSTSQHFKHDPYGTSPTQYSCLPRQRVAILYQFPVEKPLTVGQKQAREELLEISVVNSKIQ